MAGAGEKPGFDSWDLEKSGGNWPLGGAGMLGPGGKAEGAALLPLVRGEEVKKGPAELLGRHNALQPFFWEIQLIFGGGRPPHILAPMSERAPIKSWLVFRRGAAILRPLILEDSDVFGREKPLIPPFQAFLLFPLVFPLKD